MGAEAGTDGKHADPVMAAETMETRQDLVRMMEGAIAKAKQRKRRRPISHPPTKKRTKSRNATGAR
jgi:hypothetical protein